MIKRFCRLSPLSFVLIACLTVPGCSIFSTIARTMPKIVPAAYAGLKGKDTVVMVWADRAIATDWPSITIDITASTQKKLLNAQAADKPDELDGTTFPASPQSVARFQMDHPEAELMPITQVAPMVGVKRLIYVEVVNFQTRSDLSVNTDLFRGQITANVKVVEWDGTKAKIAYEESKITAIWPKKAPQDGVLNIGDAKTYVGTVDAFTTTLALRFFKHEEEREVGE
ncbi:hypothetical protein BH10PLA1_BH10PLA1_09760 [soil metagenome]